jgi:hypothetical protein
MVNDNSRLRFAIKMPRCGNIWPVITGGARARDGHAQISIIRFARADDQFVPKQAIQTAKSLAPGAAARLKRYDGRQRMLKTPES